MIFFLKKYTNGFQDSFYWGFTAANATYFLNPHIPQLIGVDVPNNTLPTSLFCGQAVLYASLPKISSSLQSMIPAPLFLKFNESKSIKAVFNYHSAATYDNSSQVTADIGIFVTDSIGNFSQCLQLRPASENTINIQSAFYKPKLFLPSSPSLTVFSFRKMII
jgi:hypothetical protein